MRIVYFGAETVAERGLKALLRAGHEVVGLVTTPLGPEPSGLRRLMQRLWPRGLDGIARRHRIPLLRPDTIRSAEFLAWLEARRPDLLVVSIYDRILPAEVLAAAPMGGINLHPSLLPRWRGPSPVARALLSGEAETGLTVHQMDVGIDTGPLLVQRRVPILADDTQLTLFDRLAQAAPAAILEAIAGLEAGTIQPQAQAGPTSQAPRIAFEEGHLDWHASTERLMRTIRACHPLPGAFMLQGNLVTVVLEARPEPGRPEARPGQVLEVGPEGVLVQAGDGALRCRGLRQRGKLIPPRHYARHFTVGELLASGDWTRLTPV